MAGYQTTGQPGAGYRDYGQPAYRQQPLDYTTYPGAYHGGYGAETYPTKAQKRQAKQQRKQQKKQ